VWTDVVVLAHHQGTDILQGWSFHVAPPSFVENHTSARIIPTTSGLPLGVTTADLQQTSRQSADSKARTQ
jgi:hypothetical protein